MQFENKEAKIVETHTAYNCGPNNITVNWAIVHCPEGEYYANGKKFYICALDSEGKPRPRNCTYKGNSLAYVKRVWKKRYINR